MERRTTVPSGSVHAAVKEARVRDLHRWAWRARAFPYPPRIAAEAMALLWLVGGLTTLLAVILPHPPALRVDVFIALGITSPIVALAIYAGRDRLTSGAYPWLLSVGTGIITALVAAGGGGSASVSLSYFYTWVVVYALLFFRPAVVVLHIVLVAVAYAGALARMAPVATHEFTALEPLVFAAVAITTGTVVRLLSHMREVTEIDPLTGVINRRGLDRILAEVIERPERDTDPLVLAIVDVDHFKAINDRSGHQVGDQVLQELVAQWRTAIREGDTLARFGGDEFVVVLPECAPQDAEATVERLRREVSFGVTCSVGIAQLLPGDSASMLLSRADAALYEAKRQGRDRAAWAGA
jgi:diguanylate cyclase (GGDEF)-like protein